MELRQILYFLEVRKTGRISKAAKNLYVTQPTITTSIKNLEQELNVQLFERKRDGLVLTKAGETFEEHAIRIYSEIEDAVKDMADYHKEFSNRLFISIPHVSCGAIFSLIHSDFLKRYPKTPLSTSDQFSEDVIRNVVSGKVNIGFCIYDGEYSDELDFIEYSHGHFHVMIPVKSELAKYDEIPLVKLQSQTLIFSSNGDKESKVETRIFDLFEENNLQIPEIIKIEDYHNIMKKVAMSEGVYPFAHVSESEPYNFTSVTSKRLENSPIVKTGLIIRKDAVLSEYEKAFINWYKEIVAKKKCEGC